MHVVFLAVAAGLSITGCIRHPQAVEPPAPAAESVGPPAPRIVARVNGVDIQEDTLVRMMAVMSAGTPTAASSGSKEMLRQEALNQVILRELALQQAARQGIQIDQHEISRAMDSFIKSVGSESGFQGYLEKEHTTKAEVRAQIENSLLLQELFNKEVLQKISISEDEVKQEYESLREKYIREGKEITFEEAKDLIANKLKAAAQMKRVREWEQELKRGAKIEILEPGVNSQEQGAGSQKPNSGTN